MEKDSNDKKANDNQEPRKGFTTEAEGPKDSVQGSGRVVKDSFLACPGCLCFDTDFADNVKPGDVCPCCGEGKIERLQRRDFMRAIARHIVNDLL